MQKSSKKKRNWSIFLLLQFFSATGYWYIGRPKRFIVFLGVFILTLLIAYHGLWGFLAQPIGMIIFYAVSSFVILFYLVDTLFHAFKCSSYEYHLKWYNKWWFYLGVGLLGFGGNLFISSNHIKDQLSFRNYSIPAGSMKPSLLIGDYIVTNRHTYVANPPQLGDIIIFAYPPNPSVHWVKRVVALPNDTIQIKNGQIILNNQILEHKKLDARFVDNEQNITQYLETMPNEKSYITLDLMQGTRTDNTEIFTVPDDHYFVMGDNRDNSTDSRLSVGFVPFNNIKGRVTGIYFSSDLNRIGAKF